MPLIGNLKAGTWIKEAICFDGHLPIQLDRISDYAKLPHLVHSVAWICCECFTVNPPRHIDCNGCGKQRWFQLHISQADAAQLAERIK